MRRHLILKGALLGFLSLIPGFTLPAALYTVTNVNDSGAGSLRQAIVDSNASVGVKDTIAFNIPGAGPFEIVLTSVLPDIVDPVIIDGSTQPTNFPDAFIVLNGAALPATFAVLTISAGSSEIKSLSVVDGNDAGIRIQTNGGNLIQGCRIGKVGLESRFPPRPNAGPGIDVVSGVGNQLDSNLISGNGGSAIVVRSAATGVQMYHNSMNSNAAPQIDLGGDGRTLNDAGDGDTGANNLMNFPVPDGYRVDAALSTQREVLVRGHLDAAPLTTYGVFLVFGRRGKPGDDLEVFPLYPFSGHIANVTTDASGHATFSGLSILPDGLTAFALMARDPANNMSELSDPMEFVDLVTNSGCGACGLEWLFIPALAAVIRRRRR
jgi:hypothetical protein